MYQAFFFSPSPCRKSSGEEDSDSDNREDDDDKPTRSKPGRNRSGRRVTRSRKKSRAFPESNFAQVARSLDRFIDYQSKL